MRWSEEVREVSIQIYSIGVESTLAVLAGTLSRLHNILQATKHRRNTKIGYVLEYWMMRVSPEDID